MFGKRSSFGKANGTASTPAPAPAAQQNVPVLPSSPGLPAASHFDPPTVETRRSDDYYVTKSMIFGALIEAIDLAQLSKLD